MDDEEQVRTIVTWQLEAEGFEVIAAADGDSALRALTSSDPDLIVLDLSLPSAIEGNTGEPDPFTWQWMAATATCTV